VNPGVIVLDSIRVLFLHLLPSMHELQNDTNRKKSCFFFCIFLMGGKHEESVDRKIDGIGIGNGIGIVSTSRGRK